MGWRTFWLTDWRLFLLLFFLAHHSCSSSHICASRLPFWRDKRNCMKRTKVKQRSTISGKSISCLNKLLASHPVSGHRPATRAAHPDVMSGERTAASMGWCNRFCLPIDPTDIELRRLSDCPGGKKASAKAEHESNGVIVQQPVRWRTHWQIKHWLVSKAPKLNSAGEGYQKEHARKYLRVYFMWKTLLYVLRTNSLERPQNVSGFCSAASISLLHLAVGVFMSYLLWHHKEVPVGMEPTAFLLRWDSAAQEKRKMIWNWSSHGDYNWLAT